MADRYTKEQRAAYNKAYNQKLREQREKDRQKLAEERIANLKAAIESGELSRQYGKLWNKPKKPAHEDKEDEADRLWKKDYPDEEDASTEAEFES